MDLTPLVRPGLQMIERYAASGFRVSGIIHSGPILVFPERTVAWAPAEVSEAGLSPVIAEGGVELLLLGLGRRMRPVPAGLRMVLRQAGIAIEAMDTGAACRTFNVLLVEDRRVAAALLPPA
jgi:uncharacterized protein